ncbi:hypothetical protein [Corynebacterium silvaticum]|uniref:Uncharacterized protein n=1 Tax=Corynebacterium silvaticum TaxID=2320431 RepID=A0A7Y4LIS7_9CORY|nr:hypothetical protein [Corynebacterium silvaticum]ARU45172.1 hypothetical protein CBE74_00080 [Corynebacterium silvaticum]MBH5301004.1 hypothetical protein [Corynebacterium silvaticum]NOM65203.1 hypothetical protein [Corynebacterium silvaticum]NON70839.1 hypothetical protein [Corynebacterium silvaticum]TFA92784.1 hypothetical protein EU802_05490 [Corynebacterium silvaticum]
MSGYAKIPSFINELVDHCSTDTFYVGKTLTYQLSDLASGALEHLGITSDGESVHLTKAVVPEATNGKWSRYNIDGRLFVRKDLPKVKKLIGGWQVPNFGDWKHGSHTHYSTRKVFQKEIWYAKQLPILIDVQDPEDGKVIIGFRVDHVFDRRELDERDLHLAASLLRENINAHVSIVSSKLSVTDWLNDQQVTWELLPKGEASFTRVLTLLNPTPGSPRLKTMQNRYEVVNGFHPSATIVGKGQFSRYFGFKFRENLIVLENLDYGNALYVMYEDWTNLSRRSRIDLLSDSKADYVRIIHKKGWENRLKDTLTLKGHDITGREKENHRQSEL